jgi:N-acetylmuramoyl-L-alanine amidase
MSIFDYIKAFRCNNIKKEYPNPLQVKVNVGEIDMIKALDLNKVKFIKSPNQSARKGDVKYIVLHHTGPGSFNGIVKWLCNKQAKASAHYVLGTAGQLNQLVNTGKEAWHAGIASWDGKNINNHHSIGIEICNYGILQKGDGGAFYYEQGRKLKKYTGKIKPESGLIQWADGMLVKGYFVPYPEKQIEKLISLCKGIIKKYPQIGPKDILTHYEIAQPQGRKNDPFGLYVDEVIKRIFL